MRIGSTLSGANRTALDSLHRAFADMSLFSMRLSTLHRINRGSDDPAGVIAVGKLQSELAALEAASSNAGRAQGMIHVADSALDEVSGLMRTVRGHVIQAAGGGLSDEELEAKQIEVNAALEAIDRIGATTSYGGRKLLDGGKLTFMLSPDMQRPAEIEMPEVSTAALGGEEGSLSALASGGAANLVDGDLGQAMAILDAADQEVLGARAEMGAFARFTIESSRRVMDAAEVNLSEAVSRIYDTDVALESSRLLRSRLLARTAIMALRIDGERLSMAADLMQPL